MKKSFSSSYTTSNENFVIICNDPKERLDKFKDSALYGLYCVVQNIIQRGFPTEPSEYLKSELGDPDFEYGIRFISSHQTYWDKTIRGDEENSDYPAALFFNKRLTEHLGEYGFVRNLMIPEASFEEILGTNTSFSGQQVDFFLPQLSLVIEIDGQQHNDLMQAKKDQKRDAELNRHKITIQRISAKDVRNNSRKLKAFLSDLKEKASNNIELCEYKESLDDRPAEQICKYETVLRLQILLLTCLRERRLNINSERWKVKLLDSDIEELDGLLNIAYSDLQLWIDNISKMLKINVEFPKLEFVQNEAEADICIDFSLFKRYDDTCDPQTNEYIIRTDYFSKADHYHVCVSDSLKYRLELEEPSRDVEHLQFILRNIFGFESFQDGQIPIIENALSGNDTIGILPTGAGKSLCYQFCAMLQPGVTLIVDPILSLMQDQKRSMDEKQITHNEMIASNMTGQKRGTALEKLRNGQYQMVWISPERFQSEAFRDSLAEINISLNFCYAVIDEVHCLSEWGHDFRVSYLTLTRTLREYCPAAILIGLTATASEFVLTDIRAEFGDGMPLEWANVKTRPSMDRPELVFKRYSVADDVSRLRAIHELIKEKLDRDEPQAGLLFCPTVKGWGTGCEVVSNMLAKDFSGRYQLFHGKEANKEQKQKAFMEGAFPLMICTKAFGMGVDKQDLRFTIHDSLPASIESFYQEAGRAGRDRQEAECYILYNIDDDTRSLVEAYSSSNNLLELIESSDDSTFQDTDLSSTIFFYKSNHMDETTETDYIFRLYQFLRFKGHSMLFHQNDSKADDFKQKTENALYKLSLLGFIEDWTVQYYDLYTGAIYVKTTDLSNISTLDTVNRFLSYVRKYEVDFSLQSGTGLEYQTIFERPGDQIKNIIQMLVRWTNQNILYQRLQCSKTIMDWCSPSVDDETFRRNLEGYFRFSDETVTFEYIAYHPTDEKRWFEVLYELNPEKTERTKPVTRESAQENLASLQRFLESFQNNTGLNYIDGLLRLYTQDTISEHDLDRMKRSLEVIKTQFTLDDQADIIRRTSSFGRNIESIEMRDLLSKTLLEYFPEMTRIVFNGMNDRYSLSIELEDIASRLENIKWII